MSEEDQNRFMDAVMKMAENKDGVNGTSEFARIAGYHGWPSSYCEHGVESFPAWHRAYLAEFELALRKADIALGNDGEIALPYWDWTVNQMIPPIARARFSDWPAGLFPDSLAEKPALRRNSDATFKRYVPAYDLVNDAKNCLLTTQHFAHACTGYEWASSYPSVEKSHNSIHVMVGGRGGPMSSVAWAAFDICFWLHHCNVDRIYEGYLKIETDSLEEYRSFQASQSGTDRFTSALEPFKRETGEDWLPEDTFDTGNFKYSYDAVPELEAPALTIAPTLVLLEQLRVTAFDGKCYEVHAWLCDSEKQDEWQAAFDACESELDAIEMDSYAGAAGIFGRGRGCDTCREREPFDLTINATTAMARLALPRSRVAVKVYCIETTDFSDDAAGFVSGSEVAGLPDARLVGPLFEHDEAMMDEEHRADAELAPDVGALQEYLAAYGLYAGALDGDYGPVTAQAVKDMQEAAGITVDSIAGPETKGFIHSQKRCVNKDAFGENEVKDEWSDEARAALLSKIESTGKKVSYSVGPQPGYLAREEVLKCIAAAFAQWSAACALEFALADDYDSADIKLYWDNESKEQSNPLRFDGVGGVLGRGGNGFVAFDIAERWTTDPAAASDLADSSTWYRGAPVIDLGYTALHELGHSLGLDHSKSYSDVMSPYYNPAQSTLTDNDIARIQALYGPDEADSSSSAAAAEE